MPLSLSLNRAFFWPLLVALGAVLAVMLWGWEASGNDRRLAEQEQLTAARHLTKAIQGTILSQVSRDCVDAERVRSILSNVRQETGLASVSLYVEGKLFLEAEGQVPPLAVVAGESGQARAGEVFYSWGPLNLVVSPRGRALRGGGGGGGCLWRDKTGETRPLQELKMTLVLGFPTRDLDARLAAARFRLWLSLGSGILTIMLLTAAWLLNAGRQNLQTRLGRLEAEKSRLEELQLVAAGVAHETKNPLGIIRGLAQRIEHEPEATAGVREMAAKIVDEADVTAERLADFLSFARMREARLQSVEALPTLDRIVSLLQGDFAAAGVALQLECPSTTIQADPDLLSQIIVNLLMNSLVACKAGGAVHLVVEVDAAGAVLRIEDNGCGMAPELLQDIFKPYVSGRPEGHGIGLSIVRRLAETMGWRIRAQSELGRGTTMTIEGIRTLKP